MTSKKNILFSVVRVAQVIQMPTQVATGLLGYCRDIKEAQKLAAQYPSREEEIVEGYLCRTHTLILHGEFSKE